MATYNDGPDRTHPVAADYSSSGQYLYVALNSSEQAATVATRGVDVEGVLQDNPDTAGYPGVVRVYGTTKVIAGGTFATGDPLTPNASGQAIKAVLPTDQIVSRAQVDAVVNDVAEVTLEKEGALGDQVGRNVYENFNALDTTDQVANIQPDGTAADGTADALNHCYTPGGNVLGYEALGAGQTITGPVIVEDGLDIGGDQADNEGYEIFSHFLGATGKPFVIGKDPAFYFECKIETTLANGTDDLQVGFRRAEISRPNFDDIVDAATLGCNTAAAPMAIKIATILNNGATTETDTTDTVASATAVTFKILVSAAGVVTYTIDGSAPTATAAFTFDNGDPVIPFVRFLNATAAQVGNVIIHSWDAGYQA